MNLDCKQCGAQLEVLDDTAVLRCEYCGASRLLVRPGGRWRRGLLGVGVVAGIVGGAVVLGTVSVTTNADDRPGPRAAPSADAVPPTPPRNSRPGPPAVASPPPSLAPPPAPRQPRPPEQPPAPVMSPDDAKATLTPELLTCLQTHEVHAVVVRLGQGYAATDRLYAPLRTVHATYVDGFPISDFEDTPLGRCVIAAANEVWAPAAGGAYLYFDLRNSSVPDPLAGADQDLDRAKANEALIAQDGAARECGHRQLEGFRATRSVALHVRFQGADGRVTQIRPLYVDPRSPYGQCVAEAFAGVVVPRFRRLWREHVHRFDTY